MTRYIALVDFNDEAYGASFPDLSGRGAMGRTLNELWANSVEARSARLDATEAAGEPVPAARPLDAFFKDEEVRAAIREGVVSVPVPVQSKLPPLRAS